MKNYDETIRSVFNRINEYESRQKRKKRIMAKIATSLCCACLVVLLGIGAWHISSYRDEPVDISSIDNTEAETTGVTNGTEITEKSDTAETKENAETIGGIGGYSGCPVHHQSYHDIPMSLINYIGQEEFFKWTELDEGNELLEGCRDNKGMYDCIHYFDIPREVLEEIYYEWTWYTGVWNLDVLYDNDKSVSDEFYRDDAEFDTIIAKRNAVMDLKLIIAKSYWDTWTSLYGNTAPTPQHSIKYLIELFDVPREKLEEYILMVNAEDTYKYDVDVLYSLVSGDVKIDGPTPIKEDALFCGFEDLYVD